MVRRTGYFLARLLTLAHLWDLLVLMRVGSDLNLAKNHRFECAPARPDWGS
jgi:hypothetical protein